MQENFIDELEQQGKGRINDDYGKIKTLNIEVDTHIESNKSIQGNVDELLKEQETVTGATEKLRELGTLKGKISNKVTTITKEHKFFTNNTVCPTCTQPIQEEFRINKIDDAQTKAKELQSGYKELEQAIKEEESESVTLPTYQRRLLNSHMAFLKIILGFSGCQQQIRDLESEIQKLTEQLADRNTEHEKLTTFKDKLKTTYSELSTRKDTISYYDFAYSLLRDGGVKTKIIKKYLPLINQQVNRYLQKMDFYIKLHT